MLRVIAGAIAALLGLAVVVGIGIVAPAWLLAYAVTSLSLPQAIALVVAARLVLPTFNFNK